MTYATQNDRMPFSSFHFGGNVKFFKPVIWIDQKIQALVNSVAHFILAVFGIPLSFQRYCVITFNIVTLVADYFFLPMEKRNVIILIINLLIAVFLTILSHKALCLNEEMERKDLSLTMPKDYPIYFPKIFFTSFLIASLFGKINPMSVSQNIGWLIYFYLFLTPPAVPPVKQHKEVPSLSS